MVVVAYELVEFLHQIQAGPKHLFHLIVEIYLVKPGMRLFRFLCIGQDTN